MKAFLLVAVVAVAALARFKPKRIDVGLGPEPLINNVYHKRALELYGYSAETFVSAVYFITDEFDVRCDLRFSKGALRHVPLLPEVLRLLYLLTLPLLRYRCLYIYFNGGPMGMVFRSRLIKDLEPRLYKLARVKVVAMPYGGDVHEMARCRNLLFKNAMAGEYPNFRFRRRDVAEQVDRWTRHANHVVSGCDWVDYMYHWDTLMLGHFSIDLEHWKPAQSGGDREQGPLRVLHAPNHRKIKGTGYFVKAIDELRNEGVNVELTMLEKVPNDEIRRTLETVDIVADQLVVGWYAMFALEGMAMEKPVLCYLRQDLLDFYSEAGLIASGDIPIVNCSPETVKDEIRALCRDRKRLLEIGRRSRQYVAEHHSLEAVGAVWNRVNRAIGVEPSRPSQIPCCPPSQSRGATP
jgi:glycosyltransferase involved in cell wall biosynthesis